MPSSEREIQELLADYATALRDGCLPTYLRSLTQAEASKITSAKEFWQAAEATRAINSAGFAEAAVKPDVGLFISRVDAEIGSRIKKAKASSRRRTNRSRVNF